MSTWILYFKRGTLLGVLSFHVWHFSLPFRPGSVSVSQVTVLTALATIRQHTVAALFFELPYILGDESSIYPQVQVKLIWPVIKLINMISSEQTMQLASTWMSSELGLWHTKPLALLQFSKVYQVKSALVACTVIASIVSECMRTPLVSLIGATSLLQVFRKYLFIFFLCCSWAAVDKTEPIFPFNELVLKNMTVLVKCRER